MKESARQQRKTPTRPERKPAASVTKNVLAIDQSRGVHISPKWKWHYRALLALRERLRNEQNEQLRQAAEPLEAHSMSIADTATDELDHDIALAHLSAEQDALFEIEEALQRIRDGRYGLCEKTRRPIAAARLRAVPWTRFCREAQDQLERNGDVKRERLGQPASVRTSTVEGFEQSEIEGEAMAEPEPEDETLWQVRTPKALRLPRGKSPRKHPPR